MPDNVSHLVEAESPEEAYHLFGTEDRHLRLIREALGLSVTARNGLVRLEGEEAAVREATRILENVLSLIRSGVEVPRDYVEKLLGSRAAPAGRPEELGVARTPGQERYVRSILDNDIVFSIGPAGTGKTYLAVLLAVRALGDGKVKKLVLCRPAVEAGERLGFLPGDLQAKVNPYLRPLYDALHEILEYEQVKRYIEREIIEVIPLAYMRGRTLNQSFIILDEAQNTSPEQMKMFLTRMGVGSKIVVTGDITQIDLPEDRRSGLVHVAKLLKGIRGIGWVYLDRHDIVRHPLVKLIVEAYEKKDR